MLFFLGGGLLPTNGILPGAKFALRPSLSEWYKEWIQWNYGTFAPRYSEGGHHVGHTPTFYTVFEKKQPLCFFGHNLCEY